jgi:hypothetical protein
MAETNEKLATMIREQNQTITQLQSTLTSMQNELLSQKRASLKEEELSRMKVTSLEQKISEVDKWSNIVRDLQDIPGVRTPRWYEIDIDLSEGATQTTFNSVEISPDGPFVITQMQPYFQFAEQPTTPVDNVRLNNRIVPCTAFNLVNNALGTTTVNDGANQNTYVDATLPFLFGSGSPLEFIPELSFQIEIAGSGRFWTNRPIPAAAFYGLQNPLYTGIAGWVERTDRIVIHVTPEIPVPLAGRVKVICHGYQILGHVNIGQALGY